LRVWGLLLLSSIMSALRLESSRSSQGPGRQVFAIELDAIGALNLPASIAFILDRLGWGWWVVLGMQAGIFLLALVEEVLTDLGRYYMRAVALLTAFLLVAFRKARATPKSFVGSARHRRREARQELVVSAHDRLTR
jgi:hypothetical protein